MMGSIVHRRWVWRIPPETPAERLYAAARHALRSLPGVGTAYWHDVMAWAHAAEGNDATWVLHHAGRASDLRWRGMECEPWNAAW